MGTYRCYYFARPDTGPYRHQYRLRRLQYTGQPDKTKFLSMRKYLKNIGFICLLALVGIARCYAQSPADVQSRFEQYNKLAPQEKLYVHTDKNTYTTGELMWFKLYYVDGTYQHPADMSKVAYIEILDKDQYAVIQAKIELKNGTGSGSVFVPVNLAAGNYILRAY